MSMYAVKNDEGFWQNIVANGKHAWGSDGDLYHLASDAKTVSGMYGGHVVELVEAPEKVVVSAEEADILKRAATERYPASFIMGAVASNDALYADKESEDRLVHAYVNGWVVEQDPKYYVKVPGKFAGGDRFYCRLREEFIETAQLLDGDPRFMLTMAEIEHYGLGDCEKVRVE